MACLSHICQVSDPHFLTYTTTTAVCTVYRRLYQLRLNLNFLSHNRSCNNHFIERLLEVNQNLVVVKWFTFYAKSSRTIWPYGMARPAGRTNSSAKFTQACRTEWRHKLLTDAAIYITLPAFSNNALAVRFSHSTIFFISEFLATVWPLIEILRCRV